MKKINLEPNNTNLINAFTSDSIGRSEDICSFVNLLRNIEGSFSLGIDGRWGTGKTFFVKQTKLVLDAFNPNVQMEDIAISDRIKKKYFELNNKENEFEPIVTAYYDAWQHDDEEEPVLSLLYEIMKDNYNNISIDRIKSWGDILASVADAVSGRSISNIIKEFKGKYIFENQKQNEEIYQLIEKFFKSFLVERGNKLVIFIDELDRCSPIYAVKLFERIKHFFMCENVIFVFSINFRELQNTIKNFYGGDFDACRYLDRFFDTRMELPPIEIERYISSIGYNRGRNLRTNVCNEVIKQMNLGMREISSYLQFSKICAYKYTDTNNRYITRDDGSANLFCFSIIVPIALGLKMVSSEDYDDFINGRNSVWLERIILSDTFDNYIVRCLLNKDEEYQKIDGKNQVGIKQKIQDVYDAIFVKDYSELRDYETEIGRAIFDREHRKRILKAIALVSPYTDYLA